MATSDRDPAPPGATRQEPVTDNGFPTTLHLPDGFEPESIGIGTGPLAYFGSLADGSIYRVDLRTGAGEIITVGNGAPSAGIKVDPRNRLWVAGAFSGEARVVDGNSGEVLATYRLATTPPTLVNDFVITSDAAYATDSFTPVLYRLPFRAAGPLPAEDEVRRIPLTGEMVYHDGFNANGIARTPDGAALLVMQSNVDRLFRVDPETGVSREVDLGGETLEGGDGIHLDGRTLYVALGPVHQIAVVRLDVAGSSGRVVDRISDPRFDLPTAVAVYDKYLYVPNARFFSVPEPTPTTPYTAVAVALR